MKINEAPHCKEMLYCPHVLALCQVIMFPYVWPDGKIVCHYAEYKQI